MARYLPVCFAAALALGCRAPTQVTVEVLTDLSCEELLDATITVGAPGQLETKNPVSNTDACSDGDPYRRVGSLVIFPQDSGDAEFSIKVVGGVARSAEQCEAPDYPGCIVARRSMRFVPHTELYLPILLRGRCEDVPCDAQTTCVLGACVPAEVPDPEQCVDPTACDEDVLSGGGGGGGGGGTGGGTGGGGGGGNSLPQAQCGRPSALTDDFEDSASAAAWVVQEDQGTSAGEEGGDLVLRPAVSAGAKSEARFRSEHAANLDEDLIQVEVTGMVAQQAYAYLSAERDAGRRMMIEQRGGVLLGRLVDNGVVDEAGQVAFDPAQHRFWRIREAGAMVYWEVSSDGASWIPLMERPTPDFASTVYTALGAGTDQPVAAPGVASFDDLNRVRPPAAWCPALSFADDFDDGQASIAWELIDTSPDCTVQESGGSAYFTMTGLGVSECWFQTATAFDLTGSSFTIEVPGIYTADTPMETYLRAEDDAGRYLELGVRGTEMFYMAISSGSGPMEQTAAYPPEEVWWRISELGGNVTWETSADGVTWIGRRVAPLPFPVTAMHVRLGVRTEGAMQVLNVPISIPSYNSAP